ncbi:hypothetical protein [Sporosarcina sp. SAFN-015]|uniref:hypothetical protein n=1 Tax=Sporosarcina sp. SAFN-015 TaxID=3387274 RepID=UPI003F80E5B0
MLEPIAQIDDLITIEGYGDRVFRVDGYTREESYNRDFEAEDIYYDCHCVVTAEYMMADQADVKLACRAVEADAYLHHYKMPSFLSPLFGIPFYAEVDEVFKPKVKTPAKPKVLTRAEKIDALLDERNNVGSSDDFVTVADMEAYKQHRYDEIDAQIKELTADGQS